MELRQNIGCPHSAGLGVAPAVPLDVGRDQSKDPAGGNSLKHSSRLTRSVVG